MNDLKEIAKEIKTQDNMATANPIFILFDRQRYPAEDGYGDEYIYVDRSGDCYEIEDSKDALIDFYKDDSWFPTDTKNISEEKIVEIIKKHRDIERVHVHVINVFKQIFFTKKSAEQYLKANNYHFDNPLIWCGSLWRNDEMQAVRNALINDKFQSR